jgi:integration host factor subunit beta
MKDIRAAEKLRGPDDPLTCTDPITRYFLMTKSELIDLLAAKQKHLPTKDVELAVKQVLEIMSDALSEGERIEIRGFGSFSLHYRSARQGRNPKTGDAVALSGKYVPHFKPGKELRERVDASTGTPIRD